MDGEIASCSHGIGSRFAEVYHFRDFASKLARRKFLTFQVVLIKVLLHQLVGKLKIGNLHLYRQFSGARINYGASLLVERLNIQRRSLRVKRNLPHGSFIQGLTIGQTAS